MDLLKKIGIEQSQLMDSSKIDEQYEIIKSLLSLMVI